MWACVCANDKEFASARETGGEFKVYRLIDWYIDDEKKLGKNYELTFAREFH